MKGILRVTFCLAIVWLFSANMLFSQNYVEIGSGNIPNSMPIYSSWNYSWSTLIYNQVDLGSAKTITKIALNCTNGPKTVTNQKVYAKLTPNSIFSTANYEDPLNNGYILIYQGDISFVTGWNEIILSTPIVYDGVQNLVIHWENRWGASYGPQFQSTASTINNNKNCGNDVQFPTPSQTGYLNPYPSSLTNMRFYYASSGPATPGNPTPSHNSTNISVDTDLTWTLGSNTTNYDLYLGTNPQNLPLVVSNGVAVNGINSYTVPGLLADSTAHYWKVVAKNGSQVESSPVWKFKTEYVIDQFPYNEGFEDSLVFNSFPVTSAWTITPSVSWYEYNVNSHSGLLCAKSSFYITGNTGTLRSPKVILPPAHSISFWWRNTSANKVASHDTTFFEVSTNGGASWTMLTYLSPNTQNASYVQQTIDLNSYAGNNFFFRFRRVTNNSASACNLYLDDISIFQSGIIPTLTVTPSNRDVTSPEGVTSFSVISNSAWSATSNQTWCTVTSSGSGNGTITANYTENTSATPRVANITVTVAGLSPVVVTVTQAGNGASFSVSPANQNVTAASGNTTFTVTSSSAWTAISDQTWCTVTPSGSGSGTLTATYTENTSLVQRIANITITASGYAPIVVTVTQGPANPTLTVTPPNQNVSSAAGNTSFTVNSNSSWSATSNQNWCTVTNSGSGNGIITATFEENTVIAARVATITVSVAGLTPVNVTVTQEAAMPYLNVSPGNQNVTYASGSTDFSVSSNLSWTASSDATWCLVTPSGTGAGTLLANYTENLTVTPRTAHITLNASGVSPVIVTVMQDGAVAYLNCTPMIQNVNYQAGIALFNISTNTSWSASTDANWCLPSNYGTGSGVLVASYDQNGTMVYRTANITVTAPELPALVLQIIQEPSFLELEDEKAENLKIFPNPIADLFTLRIADFKFEAKVKLLNSFGIIVREYIVKEPEVVLNASELPAGTYLLQVSIENNVFYRKVLIK